MRRSRAAWLLVAGVLAAGACPAAAEWTPGDRATLAELRAAGKHHATVLLLASQAGFADAKRAALTAGAQLQKELPAIGYLRVRAEIGAVDALPALPGVEHAAISQAQLFEVQGVGAEAPAAAPLLQAGRRPPPPTRFLPDDNRYTSLNTLGVLDFSKQYPRYDGRGVTIGIIEGAVDLASADLGTALDTQGSFQPKIIDWVSPLAAVEDVSALSTSFYGYHLEPPTAFRVQVEPTFFRSGKIHFRGQTYIPPPNAEPRDLGIGIIDGSKLVPFQGGQDLDLDGKIDSESDSFAVLLDQSTLRVWVDVGQTRDFSRALSLRDFSLAREWGTFGADDPSTPLRESTTFCVGVDAAHSEVRFRFSSFADHGMMVAGLAAGGRYLGGPRIGIAPHAAILLGSMQAAYTHTYLELAAAFFTDPRSDLVTWSGGDTLRPSDGSAFLDRAVRRILLLNDKPVLLAAGNLGPFIGQTLSPAVVDEVITVGAALSPDAIEAFRGFSPTSEHTLAPYTAAGPTDDGRVKPEVLGLTETLTLSPASEHGRSGLRDGAGPFELPPGYAVSGGTSAATPTVAGVIALLISAAKQEGVPYDRTRLKAALVSSARFLDGVEAWRQGNGLAQAPQAWELLKRIPRDWSPARIESIAPVRTKFSHRLATPHIGRGIFEREGWAVGQTATRTIRFLRTSGPADPVTYSLRWKGDTAAFRSDLSRLTLPLNMPVEMPVRVAPVRRGVNAAILDLLEPGTHLIAYQVMNTVVVAERLDSEHGYRSHVTGTVPRPGVESVFLDVPAGTRVLSVRCDLKDAYATVRLAKPDGSPFSGRGSASAFLPSTWIKNGRFELSIPEPEAGVWQLVIRNTGDSNEGYDPETQHGVKPASFALEAAALRAEASVERNIHAGSGLAFTATFVNRYAQAPVSRVEGLALGLQREERIRFTPTMRSRDFAVDVAPGTSQIEWSVEGQNSDREEVNVYVFDCSGKSPVLRGFATVAGTDRRVVVRNPTPGRWTATVDAQRVAEGGTSVRFLQTVLHPVYGRLGRTQASGTDSALTATFVPAPVVAAPTGYSLVARIALTSEQIIGLITRRDERGSNLDLNYKPYPAEEYRVPLGEATVLLHPYCAHRQRPSPVDFAPKSNARPSTSHAPRSSTLTTPDAVFIQDTALVLDSLADPRPTWPSAVDREVGESLR